MMSATVSLRYLHPLPDPPQGAVICVDLDGTLVRSDTFFESITPLLQRGPIAWVPVLFQFFRGRAALKASVAAHGSPKAETLAWRDDLVEALRRWKEAGHQLVLATASHHTTAQAVQQHLELFDHVIGTHGNNNLRGKAKLTALRNIAQDRPIWYLGDSSADLPLWKEVGGLAIAPFASVGKKAQRYGVHVVHETRPSRWAIWSRALRLQQWPKNLLLFLPALLAHQLGNTELLKNLIVAFFAFSASASAVYLFNDLLDLPSDRKHPSKRHRPLAAGWISALHALIAAPLLILLSLSIAWWLVSPPFAAVLLIYLIITSFYSLWLKKLFAIDLVILSFLYLWRIFAGAVVATTPLSFWLVAFALCFFLSLALIKRVSDLQKMERLQRHSLDRRDYILDDLPVLRAVGVATAVQALTFLILYLQSDSVQQLYRSPLFFWFAIAALAIWLIRIWLITGRNEMDDDPVQFVLKDRWSGVMVLVIAVSALMAKLLELPHWVALYWR